MPAILLYLFKVNIALLLFCLGYYAILRKLTFYTLNRAYLLLAIVFSTVYPQIDLSTTFDSNQKLTQPIQYIVLDINTKAADLVRPVAEANYWTWIVMLFWSGVAVMAFRLAMQFWSLVKIHKRSKPANIYDQGVRVITDEANPFSFWQSIYINPQHHAPEELRSIIAHEQVHVKQWHTMDILLAELSLVFYCFNPGVWLIKKAVSENLEFITDRKILKQGVDAKDYQYSLLYASFNTSPNAIVNHFNISTIKKRIMMMNSKRSSGFSLTRYGFIAPAVLALLLIFSTTKAAYIKKRLHTAQAVTEKLTNKLVLNIIPSVTDINTSNATSDRTARSSSLTGPTTTPKINIKAINKISTSTDTPKIAIRTRSLDSALVLIDGVLASIKKMNELDPANIESVNVFKGADAKKLFDADKGVVLVWTKKGANSTDAKKLKAKIAPVVDTYKNAETPSLKKDEQQFTNSGERVTNASSATEGKLAGIVVDVKTVKANELLSKHTNVLELKPRSDTSGAPYKTDVITIRGTDAKGKQPLFILNGKMINESEFKTLSPNNIESISIIKDTTATAIYGKEAVNGVVIVTTKKTGKKP